jgi:hypothetical protein
MLLEPQNTSFISKGVVEYGWVKEIACIERRCSAQTRTGMGHLRIPPGVELIPAVD